MSCGMGKMLKEHERQQRAFWKRHDRRLKTKEPVDIIELVKIIRAYTGATLKEAVDLARYLRNTKIAKVTDSKSREGE